MYFKLKFKFKIININDLNKWIKKNIGFENCKKVYLWVVGDCIRDDRVMYRGW